MIEHITGYLTKVAAERGQRASDQARYMLKRIDLGGVTGRDLDNARTGLRNGLSATSANRILTEARSFLKWARKTERLSIQQSTIDDCLEYYGVDKRKIELPSIDQIRALLKLVLAHKRNRRDNVRFVSLCLFAGLRPGEAETLSIENVKPKYLHIKRTKTGVERHAYYSHSKVLNFWLPRVEGEITVSNGRNYLSGAFREAGWTSDTRNTLRKLCVSFCACSGQFTEYQMVQQFGHSQVVSLAHYRDRAILEAIKPGDRIEEWMGIDDLVGELRTAATGKRIHSNSADSHDAIRLSPEAHEAHPQTPAIGSDSHLTTSQTDSPLDSHCLVAETTPPAQDQPLPPEPQ